jgi:hypothetical protein
MNHTAIAHNPVGRMAADHPAIIKLGRMGWFAKGAVYVLAGVLAVRLAQQASGWSQTAGGVGEASPTGAINQVARSTGGSLLLVVLAVGMFVYAAWRLLSAFMPGGTDAKDLVARVGYGVSAIIYSTFGITAVALARRPAATTDGNKTVTDLTARVMENGAGRWLIGVIGVIALATGVYHLRQGLTQDVTADVDMSAMSGERVRWTRRLGVVGEVGRAIAIGLIGYFLLRAAMTFDSAQATGLDGALRRIALHSWGVALVAVVGVGLAAYGAFCLLTFTHQRLQAPHT